MNRSFRRVLWGLLACCVGFAALPSRAADVLFVVRVLREGGCGGTLPPAPQLHHNSVLDHSAREWAVGRTLTQAIDLSGYRAVSAAGLHVRGPEGIMLQRLERTGCNTLASQGLHEIGIYQRGVDAWIVLATANELTASATQAATPNATSPQPERFTDAAGSVKTPVREPPAPESPVQEPPAPEPVSPADDAAVPTAAPDSLAAPAPGDGVGGATAYVPVPKSSLSPIMATRALQLVNNVRARGTRCGSELFGPAPPITLSATLAGVAFGHANDMATNNYFEHEDLNGKTPADRVRATGYQENLVGENIAYGPKSVDEVVQGWLDSPGHCENIMDPRFVEMGVGYATSHDSKHALYWVQVLAKPRNLTTATAPGARRMP